MDRKLVKEWFLQQWQNEFAHQTENKQALEAHLASLLSLTIKPAQLNKSLVINTRQRLLRMPISQRIYQRIRSQAQYSQGINMLAEMGGAVQDSYQINPAIEAKLTIPVLYTKASYEALDFSADSEFIVNIANERWLLHDEETQEVAFISDDLDDISKKVKDLYLADYNKYWQQAYDVLNVKPVKSILQTSNLLSSLLILFIHLLLLF
jgi:type VI secretion system protein ImpL